MQSELQPSAMLAPPVLPRTDIPALCTVSLLPDMSGCHHSSGCPLATLTYPQLLGSQSISFMFSGVSDTQEGTSF